MSSSIVKINPTYPRKNEHKPDLDKIVKECMKNTTNWGLLENDIMFAATFWFMTESGFTTYKSGSEKKSKNNDEEEMTLPENWKHQTKQIYEAQFILPPYEEHVVRLVGFPADDLLCINVLVSNVSPRNVNLKSLAISSSGFVPSPEASTISCKFANLEYYRLHLLSTIIWPIRCSILTDEGIINGSLSGLSDEIKLKILYHLDYQDLIALSETCQDLYRICNDQGLWKNLFHRHFKNYCRCQGKSKECEESDTVWKENFKQFHKLNIVNKSSHHSSLDSFHTASDSTYYEVDLTYE